MCQFIQFMFYWNTFKKWNFWVLLRIQKCSVQELVQCKYFTAAERKRRCFCLPPLQNGPYEKIVYSFNTCFQQLLFWWDHKIFCYCHASKSWTLEMGVKVKIMLTQEPSDPPSCFDYPPKIYFFFEKTKVLEWSNSARKLIKKMFFFCPKKWFLLGPWVIFFGAGPDKRAQQIKKC